MPSKEKIHEEEICPVAKVAKILSDKWTMLIIRDLVGKPMRYNELVFSLQGISTRTLVLKLKKLEELEMINKNKLYYALTAKGKKLNKVIQAMSEYGENNL